MHVLSVLLCPNCGHQELWHDPQTSVYVCNKCWLCYAIYPWMANKPTPPDPTPMKIFELAESQLDPSGNVIDKGVAI